jgi:hypothetical protein
MEMLLSQQTAQIVCSAFFAILFLQSGLDKLFNYKDNLSWLSGHFSKSILKGIVPFMLITLTFTEMCAGVLSTYGIIGLMLNNNPQIAHWGAVFSSLSILMLFFGQRIAKDYAGAGNLVNYFIASVVAILLTA